MMMVAAPAKLNLTLEILGKREDGYHEIRSIVQTLNFSDSLKFSVSNRLEYECSLPGWSAERSLVSKAARLLKDTSGTGKGALIQISKRIPLSAGLGGDSSDAVAVLRGLNLLWGLKLSLPDLIKLAGRLGSDLPLFLYGGTVMIEGRGEKVTPVHPMPHMSAVLLFPPVPEIEDKTRQMYARLGPSAFTRGEHTERFLKMLANNDSGLLSGLFNAFDEAGLQSFEGLKKYRQEFLEAGAENVHLAGSGPVLFTLMRDEVKAANILKRLEEKGLEACLTDF